MTDEELKAKVLDDEDVYESLVSEYGSEFLWEKQPDDVLMEMDEENIQTACGDDVMNALQRAFHGYDYNPYNADSREPFNPNRDYFFLNGYGNLVSVDADDEEEYIKNAINSKEDFADYCVEQGYVSEDDVKSDESLKTRTHERKLREGLKATVCGGELAGTYDVEELWKYARGKTPPSSDGPRSLAILGNQPKLPGYLGPMWDGDGLRYETQEVYNQLSR